VGEWRRLNARLEISGVSKRSGELVDVVAVAAALDVIAEGGSIGEFALEDAAEDDVESRERGHEVDVEEAYTGCEGSSSESLSSSHFPCDRLLIGLRWTSLGRKACIAQAHPSSAALRA